MYRLCYFINRPSDLGFLCSSTVPIFLLISSTLSFRVAPLQNHFFRSGFDVSSLHFFRFICDRFYLKTSKDGEFTQFKQHNDDESGRARTNRTTEINTRRLTRPSEAHDPYELERNGARTQNANCVVWRCCCCTERSDKMY